MKITHLLPQLLRRIHEYCDEQHWGFNLTFTNLNTLSSNTARELHHKNKGLRTSEEFKTRGSIR